MSESIQPVQSEDNKSRRMHIRERGEESLAVASKGQQQVVSLTMELYGHSSPGNQESLEVLSLLW